jgi:hypothetical protein
MLFSFYSCFFAVFTTCYDTAFSPFSLVCSLVKRCMYVYSLYNEMNIYIVFTMTVEALKFSKLYNTTSDMAPAMPTELHVIASK